MKIAASISEIKGLVSGLRKEGHSVSLVPTMGNLHEGHISLVKQAKSENDVVITSIFVNPTQFGPNEDFNKYPRTLEADLEKIRLAGGDIVFTPSVEEMYPVADGASGDSSLRVSENCKSKFLCGKFRPGHFDGVLTVVLKLFNICMPDVAYFGLKDYQQYVLIRDMAKELDLDVRVVPCNIVRDSDGLALSSRNSYLTSEQRQRALSLNRALSSIKNAFDEGERSSSTLKGMGLSILTGGGIDVQYIEAFDKESLMPVHTVSKGDVVAVAGFCGSTRLIDNINL